MTGSIDEFKHALGGEVINEHLARGGALSIAEALVTRTWFDARRRDLKSGGGRPTNPDWVLKRQIPFSERTWEELRCLARDWSSPGKNYGPGQVAAFLLEAAIYRPTDSQHYADAVSDTCINTPADKPDEDLEARFRNWRQPALFGQIKAA